MKDTVTVEFTKSDWVAGMQGVGKDEPTIIKIDGKEYEVPAVISMLLTMFQNKSDEYKNMHAYALELLKKHNFNHPTTK